MCRLTRMSEKNRATRNYVPIIAIESSICHFIKHESKKIYIAFSFGGDEKFEDELRQKRKEFEADIIKFINIHYNSLVLHLYNLLI